MSARALLIATLAGAVALPALAQNDRPRVFPFEERGDDPSLGVAIGEILAAADARDTDALMAYVAPNIQFSFGIDNGAAAFRDLLEASNSEDNSGDWFVEIADALRLGGRVDDYRRDVAGMQPSYCFPYISCLTDAEMAMLLDLDPYESAFVIRHDAPIHAAADGTSEVIGISSYEAWRGEEWVPDAAAPEDIDQGWIRISLGKGQAGYLATDDVRSWVGFRGWLVQQDDESWLMEIFIAGD